MGTLIEFKKPKQSRRRPSAPSGPSGPARGVEAGGASWRRTTVVGFVIVLALIFFIQSIR